MPPTDRTSSDKLKTVPLLRALVPLIAGIVAGAFIGIPVYVWIIAAVVCGATALATLKHNLANLYINLAFLFFGAALMCAHTPKAVIPQGERVWLEVQITDNPTHRTGRSARISAIAGRYRTETGKWSRSGEKLLVSFDTMYRFEPGDRLVFRGYVNPVSTKADSYSRLMRARSYTGRTYISEYSQVVMSPVKAKSFSAGIKKMQRGATERLLRLKAGPEEIAVAAAMTTGDRSGITPALRNSYARTGASHLLAVSGLHVGIVFLLINVVLYLLPLVRRGHIVKNVLAVIIIWLYAALTGMSPSVMRAAAMFTGAQAALAMSATRSSVNIMCGTAIIMLAISPGMLFDISFQLSFIAVAAILAWFGPLYRLLESRWKGLNALWAVLIVGLTASAATMPLVSHTFGVFSPAGVVLNPVVILTAHLVVMFSLVWIIIPLPLLEPVFRWLAGGPAWLQNKVVGLVGGVPGAAVEYTLPLGWVFAVYAVMIIFTAWFYTRPQKEEPFSMPL